MGLTVLVLGLAVFIGAHTFVTFRDARARAIARLGHGYRAIFAVTALAGLALIIRGYSQYRAHEWIQVWSPPTFMRHITVGLMLFAVIFVTSRIYPEPYQDQTEASDARRCKDVGVRAFAFKW